MNESIARVFDLLDLLGAPLGVAAFTAGALIQFVPRTRSREKLVFVIQLGQLLAVFLCLIFWNRHFLPYSGMKANILVNGFGTAFIAISLWDFSKLYRRMQRKGINHDSMRP
ncbi:hypothetical protein K2Y11_18315 [bacterium]|nr:hypothetical protein [bacterium]